MKTKPPTHPADALDDMLESLAVQEERRPDEFTIIEMAERLNAGGRPVSERTLHTKLEQCVKNGTHAKRQITVNHRLTNVYRVK